MKKCSRLYFKSKRLILGNGQKVGWLPITAAFAPLAASLIGKIIERGKRKRTVKNE